MAGLALGLAQATKFTLLILDPCWFLLMIGRSIQFRGAGVVSVSGRRCSVRRFLALGLVMSLVRFMVIDGLYFFHDVGFTLSQWHSGRSSLAAILDCLGGSRMTAWIREIPLPIPLEYLLGLDCQLRDTEQLQSAYLLGQGGMGGWWYWYAACCLFKVPLPVLLLFGLATSRVPSVLRCRDPVYWATLCLLIPAAQVALAITAATGTGSNAAFRYLIPSLALLCVWVGQAWNSGPRLGRLGTVGLLVWLALNSVLGIPDHLGWQNELGWMCSRETPALIGDSLDWGQDLVRLDAWISRHSREGGTLVCIYGLGEAEPNGLSEPGARPTSESWESATYLAVSIDVIFGYEVGNCVRVKGVLSALSHGQCEILRAIRPYGRVGRTIRIYRIRDLAPNLETAFTLRRIRSDNKPCQLSPGTAALSDAGPGGLDPIGRSLAAQPTMRFIVDGVPGVVGETSPEEDRISSIPRFRL